MSIPQRSEQAHREKAMLFCATSVKTSPSIPLLVVANISVCVNSSEWRAVIWRDVKRRQAVTGVTQYFKLVETLGKLFSREHQMIRALILSTYRLHFPHLELPTAQRHTKIKSFYLCKFLTPVLYPRHDQGTTATSAD